MLRQHQRTVKKAIDKGKEEWVWQVATLGEKAAKDGPTRYSVLECYNKHKPITNQPRPKSFMKDNGELTQGPSNMLARWLQHFHKLLNVESLI